MHFDYRPSIIVSWLYIYLFQDNSIRIHYRTYDAIMKPDILRGSPRVNRILHAQAITRAGDKAVIDFHMRAAGNIHTIRVCHMSIIVNNYIANQHSILSYR